MMATATGKGRFRTAHAAKRSQGGWVEPKRLMAGGWTRLAERPVPAAGSGGPGGLAGVARRDPWLRSAVAGHDPELLPMPCHRGPQTTVPWIWPCSAARWRVLGPTGPVGTLYCLARWAWRPRRHGAAPTCTTGRRARRVGGRGSHSGCRLQLTAGQRGPVRGPCRTCTAGRGVAAGLAPVGARKSVVGAELRVRRRTIRPR